MDYPGKICSVIYTYKCNLRCPYCYNIELVKEEEYTRLPTLSEDAVLEELKRRRGFIKGVAITGGEPTLWGKDLMEFIERIKIETELPVKVDTNGGYPETLEGLLKENLVDFVAIDFKTSPELYPVLKGSFERVKRSLEILSNFPEKCEVRITCYPPLVNLDTLEKMVPYLKGFKKIALQKYLSEKNLIPKEVFPYSKEEYLRLKELLERNLKDVHIIERF